MSNAAAPQPFGHQFCRGQFFCGPGGHGFSRYLDPAHGQGGGVARLRGQFLASHRPVGIGDPCLIGSSNGGNTIYVFPPLLLPIMSLWRYENKDVILLYSGQGKSKNEIPQIPLLPYSPVENSHLSLFLMWGEASLDRCLEWQVSPLLNYQGGWVHGMKQKIVLSVLMFCVTHLLSSYFSTWSTSSDRALNSCPQIPWEMS